MRWDSLLLFTTSLRNDLGNPMSQRWPVIEQQFLGGGSERIGLRDFIPEARSYD